MKNVIITGAMSGMGFEASKLFVSRGVDVLMVDMNEIEGALDEVNAAANGAKAYFCKCNLTVAKDVKAMADFAIETFGKVDSLINNAGIFAKGKLHEMDEDVWDKVFAVDVKSILLTGKYLIPHMLENGGGTIVNTASISGMYGDYNMASYNAAKGAVVNLTRSMALDYGKDGIRTNAVSPSACGTPMFMQNPQETIDEFCNANPLGRICTPLEVAKTMYFLASDESSSTNGAIITVTGGIETYSGQPVQL
ncbi:MAG: SDR family oxidoreductase [Lachnospiraceae bacterium]|nr:SDR family oxidoreductase [Lachnospiraceae bacterium]